MHSLWTPRDVDAGQGLQAYRAASMPTAPNQRLFTLLLSIWIPTYVVKNFGVTIFMKDTQLSL